MFKGLALAAVGFCENCWPIIMCSHRWSEFLVVLPFMGWQCDAVEANVSHACSNLCR